jgi:hypothetical protein
LAALERDHVIQRARPQTADYLCTGPGGPANPVAHLAAPGYILSHFKNVPNRAAAMLDRVEHYYKDGTRPHELMHPDLRGPMEVLTWGIVQTMGKAGVFAPLIGSLDAHATPGSPQIALPTFIVPKLQRENIYLLPAAFGSGEYLCPLEHAVPTLYQFGPRHR